ncbi:MAG: Gfo/Idh/MocA family oxidoreductase, partial [Clostridia bacterium]|nr:Gfo/Idh/MocA family oxidoreductase [Clostridia bacterium]
MKIKWGVLGTASIARHCTIPGMLKAESCELYAIAGRNEEKVNEFKEKFGFVKGYTGYEKLVADPDVQAVYIPLPNDIHKKWVIECLKAGK